MIPEGATKITLDVIDVITSEIIKGDGSECFAKTEALKYFFSTLSPEDKESKEVHFRLTNILSAVESFDPCDLTFEDSKPSAAESSNSLSEDPTPLVWWSSEQWEELLNMIWNLMQHLEAEESPLLERVTESIRFHQALACIRIKVEEQLAEKSSGPLEIESSLISDFVQDIEEIEENDTRRELEKMLVLAEGSRTTRSHSKVSKGVTLKPIQDLKPIFRSDPFQFCFVQRKIHKLIGKWAVEHVPSLGKYLGCEGGTQKTKKKNIDCDEEDEDAGVSQEDDGEVNIEERVETPRKKAPRVEAPRKKAPRVLHEVTGENGGVQILEDEEETDEEYAQSPVTSPRSKKRKKRINFTQEEKDAIKEGVEQHSKKSWALIRDMFPVLSKRECKAIRNCYFTMVRNGVIIDDDEENPKRPRPNSAPSAKPREWRGREKWTQTELEAVRAGVRKHHVGAWAIIKADADFREALLNRTSVQIKDAYRVLCKRNEG